MTAPNRPPSSPRHARQTGRRWTVAACFLFLWASLSARHHGQQEPSPEPAAWHLTLPTTATFPAIWTLSDTPELSPPFRPPEPESAAPDAELRARLAASVKNGRLAPAAAPEGSSAHTVTFRPWRRGELPPAAAAAAPVESIKPPGPLEDAALAAAVRSRIAADPELGKKNVAVTCQSGAVSLRVPAPGAALSWENTVALVNLALAVEPIVSVQVDLPEPPPAASNP